MHPIHPRQELRLLSLLFLLDGFRRSHSGAGLGPILVKVSIFDRFLPRFEHLEGFKLGGGRLRRVRFGMLVVEELPARSQPASSRG